MNDDASVNDDHTFKFTQGILKAIFILSFIIYCTYFLKSNKQSGQLEDNYVRKRYGGLFTYLRTSNFATFKPLLWPVVFMTQRLLLALQFTSGYLLY